MPFLNAKNMTMMKGRDDESDRCRRKLKNEEGRDKIDMKREAPRERAKR